MWCQDGAGESGQDDRPQILSSSGGSATFRTSASDH